MLMAHTRGDGLLGSEFEGNGPARVVCGSTELCLQHITVYLDHHTVSVVLEVVAMGFQLLAVGNDFVKRGAWLRARIDFQAGAP